MMIGFVHLAQKVLLMKHVPGTFYSFYMPELLYFSHTLGEALLFIPFRK